MRSLLVCLITATAACSGETPGVCAADADCSACAYCLDGACVVTPGRDRACNDGLWCNGVESCSATGECLAGAPPALDDGVACTTDTCDEVTDTIEHTLDDAACEDGDACTADVCSAGIGCTHPVVCTCFGDPDCDDGNPCTAQACAGGQCLYDNGSGACDDGVFCNGADSCDGGACVVHDGDPCSGGAECADVCDEARDLCARAEASACASDDNPCTDDACDGQGGCAHVANSASCDDGVFCNGGDSCAASACGVHAGDPCGANDTCYEAGARCQPPAQPAFVSVAAGADHVCGVTSLGEIYCWGEDFDGQLGDGGTAADAVLPTLIDTSGVSGSTRFVQVAPGAAHTCALAADHRAYCWGSDTSGQLGDGGVASSSQKPVAVDTSTLLAGEHFVSLTAGVFTSCGVTSLGNAYCWGSDSYAQLGTGGTAEDTQSPALVYVASMTGSTAWLQLSAAARHTCGVAADGLAYCWGDDAYGKLGNGTTETSRVAPFPVDTSTVSGIPRFVSISARNTQTCALTVEGVAYCWGRDDFGQLGNGGTQPGDPMYSPSAIDLSGLPGTPPFVAVDAGDVHSCGLTAAGEVFCWGSDEYGKVGNGAPVLYPQSPSAVELTDVQGPFTQITVGATFACALSASGAVACWGLDFDGQLGNGAGRTDATRPAWVSQQGVAAAWRFTDLAAGSGLTCGALGTRAAYCWGDDAAGQRGDGSATSLGGTASALDATAASASAFTQLSAGAAHACGVTAGGVPVCWGDGVVQPTAVDVSGVTGARTFLQLAAGDGFTCGVTSERRGYCWGRDDLGQLGNGSAGASSTPSALEVLSLPFPRGWLSIAAGAAHACGVTILGDAFCWGSDAAGQQGNGASLTQPRPAPTAVQTTPITGSDVFRIVVAGGAHSCGLLTDGAVYCWGSDAAGQLGNGGLGNSPSPSPVDVSNVTGDARFVALAAGAAHTCGLVAGGVAYCWGDNAAGQLGAADAGALAERPVPVDVATLGAPLIGLTAGASHTCARAADGRAYCWGTDTHGELGDDPPLAGSDVPVEIETRGL